MSGTAVPAPVVWQSYITAPDLASWMNVGNLTQLDVQLQIAVDYACTWAQNFCQRPFAPISFVEDLTGATGLDMSYLMLKWFPIIEVTNVTEWQGDTPVTLIEHTSADPIPQGDRGVGFTVDYLTGRLTRVYGSFWARPFYPSRIHVEYTAGFSTVPADVKLATLELGKYFFRRSLDPRASAKSGNFGGDEGNMLWPGVPNRVVEILQPYQNVIIV